MHLSCVYVTLTRTSRLKRRGQHCCYGAINNAIIIARSNIATTTSLLHCNIPKHKVAAFTLHAGARNSQRSRHTVQTTKKKWETIKHQKQHLLKHYRDHFSLHTQK
ncbi:hypothetical protein V8G54_007470 [Vigna mungo]|uniref:Uncharacterized protein n=1 Tax=Vigna mungo TaxID=3915 RepID=A0AAQ3S8B0_VIGMU